MTVQIAELFSRVDEGLRAVEAGVDAAEAQGVLCGMISAPTPPDKAAWIAQLLVDTQPRGEDARKLLEGLLALYESTLKQMDSDQLELQLLLPSDSEPIAERAAALGRWCQGFMAGLGLGKLASDQPLPEEVREILRDFGEISRVELEAEADEDNEAAFAELEEYVRMAALLVREHLRPAKPATEPADKTLH